MTESQHIVINNKLPKCKILFNFSVWFVYINFTTLYFDHLFSTHMINKILRYNKIRKN